MRVMKVVVGPPGGLFLRRGQSDRRDGADPTGIFNKV